MKSVPGCRSNIVKSGLADRIQGDDATKLEVRTRPPIGSDWAASSASRESTTDLYCFPMVAEMQRSLLNADHRMTCRRYR